MVSVDWRRFAQGSLAALHGDAQVSDEKSMHDIILDNERQALERLLDIARSNTVQSRRVADFLLARWNPANRGSYDITTGWGLNEYVANDVCTMFHLATRANRYPDQTRTHLSD
jgi:hypothetical protein